MSLLSFFGLTPPASDDFWYGPAATQTAAGVRVDENVAFTYSGCWACTMVLTTSGGMIPLKLREKQSTGGTQDRRDDPRYAMVHDAPNDDMTSMMFRCAGMGQQINAGNWYAEIVRNRAGLAMQLFPIHHARIPKSHIRRGADGKLFYLVKNADGTLTPIKSADMLHIPSPISDDGIVGKGVIEHARLSIGYGLAQEMQGASAVTSGNQPGIAIKNAKFKEKADRQDFRQQWDEVHSGPGKAGRPYLLPFGAEAQVLGFSLKDAQFIEGRQHSIEDIARWYGVPPHLIGHLLRSTNNNITQQSLEFVKFSLMRWLVIIEQELNRKLLTKEERRTMYFKHIVEGLERADIATRTAALKDRFFNGSLSLNRWLELEDENPIGPAGDIHFVQQAMIPVEIAAKGPQPSAPEADAPDDDDLSPRDWREEVRELRRAKGLPDVDVDEHYWGHPPDRDENGEYIVDQLSKAGRKMDRYVETLTAAVDVGLSGVREEVASVREQLPEIEAVQLRLHASALIQKQLAAAMLRDVMSRSLSAEIHRVRHIAEKAEGYTRRLREFYDKHAASLERSLSEPVAVCLTTRGDSRDAAEVVRALAAAHVAESLRLLDGAFDGSLDGLPARVEECVSKWHEERTINLENTDATENAS